MSTLAKQMQDYRLTTALIMYHMPDHPSLLQEFIWQELDLAPRYPGLRKFLKFWEENLDGRLHSVQVASKRIISPGEMRMASAQYNLQ